MVAADDNGRHFGHHCHRQTSPHLIKHRHRGQVKLINFYIYLLNQLNRFDGGIGTNMPTHGFIKYTPLEGWAASPPWWWCLLGDLCFLCVFWLMTCQSYWEWLRARSTTTDDLTPSSKLSTLTQNRQDQYHARQINPTPLRCTQKSQPSQVLKAS